MAITVVFKQQLNWSTNVPVICEGCSMLSSENHGMWPCLSKDCKYVNVLELLYKMKYKMK